MAQTIATTKLDGMGLPAPGTWKLDPGHAEIAFIGRHFMLTMVRGRFVGVTGQIEVGETPKESSVTVAIDMASVSSGDSARDDHLRSPDFFDVEKHPSAAFESRILEWVGPHGRLTGDLTIKGNSRPVSLDFEYLGHVVDPWGADRAAFTAHGRINREDWGLTWNLLLDSGGVVVSREIDIEIHAEFVKASAEGPDESAQRPV